MKSQRHSPSLVKQPLEEGVLLPATSSRFHSLLQAVAGSMAFIFTVTTVLPASMAQPDRPSHTLRVLQADQSEKKGGLEEALGINGQPTEISSVNLDGRHLAELLNEFKDDPGIQELRDYLHQRRLPQSGLEEDGNGEKDPLMTARRALEARRDTVAAAPEIAGEQIVSSPLATFQSVTGSPNADVTSTATALPPAAKFSTSTAELPGGSNSTMVSPVGGDVIRSDTGIERTSSFDQTVSSGGGTDVKIRTDDPRVQEEAHEIAEIRRKNARLEWLMHFLKQDQDLELAKKDNEIKRLERQIGLLENTLIKMETGQTPSAGLEEPSGAPQLLDQLKHFVGLLISGERPDLPLTGKVANALRGLALDVKGDHLDQALQARATLSAIEEFFRTRALAAVRGDGISAPSSNVTTSSILSFEEESNWAWAPLVASAGRPVAVLVNREEMARELRRLFQDAGISDAQYAIVSLESQGGELFRHEARAELARQLRVDPKDLLPVPAQVSFAEVEAFLREQGIEFASEEKVTVRLFQVQVYLESLV